MSNLILKYPLDLRGNSPTNLVLGERHTLPATGNRVIVPNYGPFYTQGLKVRNAITGLELEKGEQYKAVQLYTEAVQRTGKEVCAVIVIVDDSVGNEIEIDYQVVGGKFSRAVPIIQQAIEDLQIDERAVNWADIIAPPDAFPPVSHMHDAGDLYGLEYVVGALEMVYEAIIIGDAAAHQEIINTVEQQLELAAEARQAISDRLDEHINDFANPHNVTKTQVGLSNVQNYGMATKTEAEAGNRADAYMSPLRTKEAIEVLATPLINAHAANTNNPHNTTKSQVGLGNVENYGIASQAEAVAGAVNNKYMTPLRVKEAIDSAVGSGLNAHASRTDNPHSVTKAQVGLGNVENYAVAGKADAEAGNSNGLYMTPLRVKEAITAQVGAAYATHAGNTNNPHAVTKSQVGLGSVQNYGIASQAEAQNGSANDKYMTPLRVKDAITFQVGNTLTSHVNNQSNPHNVTKAQVGLGNVENYAIAEPAEATAGAVNNKFMTPLRVKQAIDAQAVNLINAHATRTDNPHNTTKAQVGLGNVQNYGVASQAEAIAGTANDKYMTPLRVMQAIDSKITSGQAQYDLDDWGYWRDPSTGYTRCWGRTASIAWGGAYYVYWRLRFTRIFTITAANITHNIDSPTNFDTDAMNEITASFIHKTLSTRGCLLVGQRIRGTNTDYTRVTYVVEGLSDGTANGTIPGVGVSSVPSHVKQQTNSNWSGGFTSWSASGYQPPTP